MKSQIAIIYLFCFSMICIKVSANDLDKKPKIEFIKTLRLLIENSEVIIIAKVKNTQKIDKNETKELDLAKLRVKKVLKGDKDLKNIKLLTVEYYPNYSCPPQANYNDKDMVLVFLYQLPNGLYRTYGDSEGLKVLNNKNEKLYIDLITEYQEIQRHIIPKKRVFKTQKWLIKCTKSRETRFDGAYDLSLKSNFRSRIKFNKSKRKVTAKEIKRRRLSALQKNELKQIFFQVDTILFEDLILLDIIESSHSKDLISFLIAKLNNNEVDKWLIDDLMIKIVNLSGRNDLLDIVNNIKQIEYHDKLKNAKTQELIKQFINKI